MSRKALTVEDKHGKRVFTVDKNNIWIPCADDRMAAYSVGQLSNGYCYVYEILAYRDDFDKEKYVPVYLDVFKYRRQLGIKFVRRAFWNNTQSSRGPLEQVKYGYIKREKMKYLLENRKHVLFGDKRYMRKLLMTKITDWEMHSR